MSRKITTERHPRWPPDLTAAVRQWYRGWRFPLRLARALSYFQLTQVDLEAMSGVSRFEINRILRGSQKSLSLDVARAIIEVFRFSPRWRTELADALLNLEFDPRVEEGEEYWLVGEFEERTFGERYRLAGTPPPLPRVAPKAHLEDARQSFYRAVRLGARGYWLGPTSFWTREENFDPAHEYLARLLRPAARLYPSAAWTLALWMEAYAADRGDPAVQRRRMEAYWANRGDPAVQRRLRWHLYKQARRGRWPKGLGSSFQFTDLGGRISRPTKLAKEPNLRTVRWDRPMFSFEEVAVTMWRTNRRWKPDVLDVDKEVFEIVIGGQSAKPTTWASPRYGFWLDYFKTTLADLYIHVHAPHETTGIK